MTQPMNAGSNQVGYMDLLRRNRSFRRLWLGRVVSQMGDWFDTLALYTLILQLTGSGRDVGLLLVARFVPSFFFGPISGVVADRFSRRRIMIISDILRAVVVLGFLFVRSADQLWIVYVLTVLQLGLSTFFEPAKTAAIPSLVEDRELVTANAISSVTWSAMLTIGAALGGLITSAFGTDAAFILDAFSYLLSAVLIAGIRLPKREKRAPQKLTLGRLLGITETIEGIKYVKDRPKVLAALLVKPAWGLGGGILTLLAVFGERIFPVGKNAAGGIGVLFAARGIGTAVGPLVARRIAGEGVKRMQASIGIAFLILLGIALTAPLWIRRLLDDPFEFTNESLILASAADTLPGVRTVTVDIAPTELDLYEGVIPRRGRYTMDFQWKFA